MDAAVLSAILEKYGPLGLAFVVVCLVLWWFISRLFPAMIETIGKRLDNVVSTVNRATNDHETNAAKRHDEIKTGLGEIKTGIVEIKERLPEKKDEATGQK